MSPRARCVQRCAQPRRSLNTALHFYRNRQLDQYAAQHAHKLSLRQLVNSSPRRPIPWCSHPALRSFSVGRWTRPGCSRCPRSPSSSSSSSALTPSLQSANYVRTELPVRIAHRIRDLQTLPFVVVNQPEVARVYEVRVSLPPRLALPTSPKLYWSAFEKYAAVLPVRPADPPRQVQTLPSDHHAGRERGLLCLSARSPRRAVRPPHAVRWPRLSLLSC